MPTYEYECTRCSHRFEEFQKITDAPVSTCPECQGPVKRLISGGSGFLFKGSGFYATDYRSEGYRKKQQSEQGAAKAPRPESAPKPAEKKPPGGGDA